MQKEPEVGPSDFKTVIENIAEIKTLMGGRAFDKFKAYLESRRLPPGLQNLVINGDPELAANHLADISPNNQAQFLRDPANKEFRLDLFKRLHGFKEVNPLVVAPFVNHPKTTSLMAGLLLPRLEKDEAAIELVKKFPDCVKYATYKLDLVAEARRLVLKHDPKLKQYLVDPEMEDVLPKVNQSIKIEPKKEPASNQKRVNRAKEQSSVLPKINQVIPEIEQPPVSQVIPEIGKEVRVDAPVEKKRRGRPPKVRAEQAAPVADTSLVEPEEAKSPAAKAPVIPQPEQEIEIETPTLDEDDDFIIDDFLLDEKVNKEETEPKFHTPDPAPEEEKSIEQEPVEEWDPVPLDGPDEDEEDEVDVNHYVNKDDEEFDVPSVDEEEEDEVSVPEPDNDEEEEDEEDEEDEEEDEVSVPEPDNDEEEDEVSVPEPTPATKVSNPEDAAIEQVDAVTLPDEPAVDDEPVTPVGESITLPEDDRYLNQVDYFPFNDEDDNVEMPEVFEDSDDHNPTQDKPLPDKPLPDKPLPDNYWGNAGEAEGEHLLNQVDPFIFQEEDIEKLTPEQAQEMAEELKKRIALLEKVAEQESEAEKAKADNRWNNEEELDDRLLNVPSDYDFGSNEDGEADAFSGEDVNLNADEERNYVNLIKLAARRLLQSEEIKRKFKDKISKADLDHYLIKRDAFTRYIDSRKLSPEYKKLPEQFKRLPYQVKRDLVDTAFPAESIRFTSESKSSTDRLAKIKHDLMVEMRNPGNPENQIKMVLRRNGAVLRETKIDEYRSVSGMNKAYYGSFYFKNPSRLSYLYVDKKLKNIEVSSYPID